MKVETVEKTDGQQLVRWGSAAFKWRRSLRPTQYRSPTKRIEALTGE